MKQTQRVKVFGIGFILGCVVVSFIISGKNAKKKAMERELEEPQYTTLSGESADPIPESVPRAIKAGRISEFNKWETDPNKSSEQRTRTWLLKFNHNYTWVQMDEYKTTDTLSYSYHAADQIQVELKEDVLRIEFQKTLDESFFHYREYHKKPNIHIVGINHATIDSVNRALEILSNHQFVKSVKPDSIIFK